MNLLLSALVAAPLVLLSTLPADADPCGMVLPIAINDDGNFRIERIGLQKTYVFYHKRIESIVIRPGFKGNVSEFGMLIPFPSPPAIRKAPDAIFRHIAAAVDPPEVVVDVRQFFGGGGIGGGLGGGGFFGGGGLGILKKDEVKVIREEAVGMYEVVVLAAGSAKALNRWMRGHRYKYPQGMDAVGNDYIAKRWCFVAVRSKVALKKRVDPKPGQRAIDTKLPTGSVFDGHVQALAFRFRSKEPVVPIRLSAFNSGSLRNVVYLLATAPAAVRDLPRSFVRRQISGPQLIHNLTKPLPIRVLGANRVKGKFARMARGRVTRGERNPHPKNGLAAELFVKDVMSAKQHRLLVGFEANEKAMTNISERLGLRGKSIDDMIRGTSERSRQRMLRRSIRLLKEMTLTVIDGDFPRDYLAENNLKFTPYAMPRLLNRPSEYDAKSAKPGGRNKGIRVSAVQSDDGNGATESLSQFDNEPAEQSPWARRTTVWLVSALFAASVGIALRRGGKRRT